jgi:peptide/nickel transport system permease protein
LTDQVEAVGAALAIEDETPFLRITRRYAESRTAVAALVALIGVILIAVFAPLISPQNPYDLNEIDLQDGRLPPGSVKLSEETKVGVSIAVQGLGGAAGPDLTVKPIDRGGDAPATSMTFSLSPRPDGERAFALDIAALADGPLDPLAAVQIDGLPRGSTLSAGSKSKFRNVWKLDTADLTDLILTLPPATADGFRFRLTASGGPRRHLMTYWLGTDDQGRDMLSAIFYGLRISLIVAVTSVLIALTIGTLVGIYAAYHGGRIDALIMRLVDLQLSFPTILVALILLAILGKGILNVMLALVIVQWALYARTARGTALAERSKEYVEAAHCLGLGTGRIILVHILPNCLPSLIVIATLEVAHAVSLEATLSFLGLGLPVTEPSLGLLISNGFDYLLSGYPWISVLPGVALLITVISINLVVDELRDILNPRLQQ